MLSEEYGGRVELAKAYFRGLTESVRRHFGGNGVMASMEHCNDFMLLGTKAVVPLATTSGAQRHAGLATTRWAASATTSGARTPPATPTAPSGCRALRLQLALDGQLHPP